MLFNYTRRKVDYMQQESCFNCLRHECKTSCCGAFNGFSDKLNSIDNRSFTDIILTYDDAKALLNSEYKDLVYHDDDNLYKIKTAEDGTCSAFKDGKCIINEIKPTICKCYPLYLDICIGLCSQKDCAAVHPQYTLNSYKNEIKPFLKMCEFWIQYYTDRPEMK